MTLIIDIPEDAIPRKVGNDHIELWLSLCDGHVTQCDFGFTEIPDNATNEDVAELVWGFKPRENTCIIPKTECNGNPAECDGCSFDDWWKEQYQKGGK